MRLLFFNRSFHPDVEATGQLLTELCEELAEGHDVTVVAGRPYNMGNWGSCVPVRQERLAGIRILRAYNPRLNKRRFMGRVLNLLSYFCFSVVAGCFARRPDVVIVETDPPVLGLVALFFARLHKAKFVFYLQDLYPDVGVALGKLRNPMLVKLLEAITRRILARSDRVVVLADDMKRRVEAKGYRHPDRICVIPNWVDTSQVRPYADANPLRAQHQLDNQFVVMFSGNLGLSQGLERVIEVAGALRDQSGIRFMFVGDGAAKAGLITKAAALGLKNVMFLPYEPKTNLWISLSAADVHLVPLQRGLAGLIVPSKVYGIMAAGRPFIAPVEEGSHVAEIIGQYRCGVRVDPDSPDQLKKAILWAMNNRDAIREMGQRGRQAAERYFDRKVSVAKFRTMLDELGATAVPLMAESQVHGGGTGMPLNRTAAQEKLKS